MKNKKNESTGTQVMVKTKTAGVYRKVRLIREEPNGDAVVKVGKNEITYGKDQWKLIAGTLIPSNGEDKPAEKPKAEKKKAPPVDAVIENAYQKLGELEMGKFTGLVKKHDLKVKSKRSQTPLVKPWVREDSTGQKCVTFENESGKIFWSLPEYVRRYFDITR
jgi:hypothetical protein